MVIPGNTVDPKALIPIAAGVKRVGVVGLVVKPVTTGCPIAL
jgi:hypothetical protein